MRNDIITLLGTSRTFIIYLRFIPIVIIRLMMTESTFNFAMAYTILYLLRHNIAHSFLYILYTNEITMKRRVIQKVWNTYDLMNDIFNMLHCKSLYYVIRVP